MAQTDLDDPAEAPYRRFNIPATGFRNYWYPIVTAGEVGRKPKAVRLLGEDIVLFRDAGKLFALEDRCPHRGVKLSIGACEYAGTGSISCPYHGWTFDGATGQLIAALMDGPDSPINRKVRIKSYPVRQHAGLIFLFVGDMEPVPLEDDLPEFVADQDKFFTIARYVDYKANWRWLVDNWPNDHHGPYVHRSSPELIFQPVLPFGMTVTATPIPGNKGIGVDGRNGITSGYFAGLGTFPQKNWWRFMKPVGRGKTEGFENSPARVKYGIQHQFETRLPGAVVVGRQSGEYCLVQWATPIDANTTRCFNVNNWRRHSPWRSLYDRFNYYVWRGWAHDWIFSGQDKKMIENVVPGPERLSKTDAGVIAWRKYAGSHARRPPEQQQEMRQRGAA
jgi:nitrite reductase/ring-hydroxylating ferredoxin subunit